MAWLAAGPLYGGLGWRSGLGPLNPVVPVVASAAVVPAAYPYGLGLGLRYGYGLSYIGRPIVARSFCRVRGRPLATLMHHGPLTWRSLRAQQEREGTRPLPAEGSLDESRRVQQLDNVRLVAVEAGSLLMRVRDSRHLHLWIDVRVPLDQLEQFTQYGQYAQAQRVARM